MLPQSRKDKLLVAIVLVNTFLLKVTLQISTNMRVFFAMGAYLITLSFFTYYCIIADPSQSRLAHLLTIEWPTKLRRLASDRIGEEYVNQIQAVSTHFLYMAYVVIVFGSWGVIFVYTYPWIDSTNGYVSSNHKIIGCIVFVVCIASWRWACSTSPGIITADNLEQYNNYPFDEILFVNERICPTVGIPKLARSKYDRFSNVHVAKFDQFCGWLGNPVGEENYRWFLLFLFVHTGMLVYGAIILGYLFQSEINKLKIWDVMFINRANGEEFHASPYVIFQYLFQRFPLHSALLLMFLVLGFVMILFLGYHLWITSRGMTTNEASKWSQVRQWYKAELKRYNKAVKEGHMVVKKEQSTPTVIDGDVTCLGAKTEQTTEERKEMQQICHPGPMPKNIYNYGFAENWRDVLFPRSLRKESIARLHKATKDRNAKEQNSKQSNSKLKES